jgi:hypothetical protein
MSMAAFQFSKTRTKKADISPRLKDKPWKDTPAEPPVEQMYIQNKKASAPEWRVGKALDRLGVKYQFQKSILGGRVPGGQVLDYYIYTVPLPTPLNVQGEYSHRLAKGYTDALKANQTNELFDNSANPLVLVWERELGSVDQAYMTLKQKLGGW